MRNPEFRRNLWLEFTSIKLIVWPVVIGLILLAAAAIDYSLLKLRSADGSIRLPILAGAAYWCTIIVALLWGGRQAAGSVIHEVRGRTWDAQRMSALRPWPMVWGKLLGSTALTWLVGICCLIVYVVARSFSDPVGDAIVVSVVLASGALLAQSVGMLISILRLTSRPGEKGGNITLIQAGGLVATLAIYYLGRVPGWADASWYGIDLGPSGFSAMTLTFFALWGVVGVYRRMRRELQMVNRPWVWLLFLATVVAYSFGFVATVPSATVKLLVPGLVLGFFVYVLTVVEAKDPLSTRRALAAARRGRFVEAASTAPLALLTIVLFVIVKIVEIALIAAVGEGGNIRLLGQSIDEIGLTFALATLLFAIRDISLVWVFSLTRDAKLAEAYGLVAWFILYGPIPIILVAGISRELLPVFYPVGILGWELSVLPALVIAVLCLILLVWRWHRFWKQGGPQRRAPKKPSSADGSAPAAT